MELVKNFINNVVQSVPHVTKVAYISTQIKKCLLDLDAEENQQFNEKLAIILSKFVRQEITLDQMCTIVDAADGINLSRSQLNYFCNRAYLDRHLLDTLQKYVDCNYLSDSDIHYVSEFLVCEINKAIING
nr:ac75 [Calliteara abietis nucleopolyhedrovirus]